MYKLGLIGYPLGHSISGVIQQAGLKSLGVEGEYNILETTAEELVGRLKYLKHNNYDGFNVTIPLKVPIKLFLGEVDRFADIAGCANTIKIMPDKTLYGYNTDVFGFQNAIPQGVDLKGKKVSILGTGGAARAATVALADLGVAKIDYYTRNIINSSDMLSYVRGTFSTVTFNVFQIQQFRDVNDSSMLVNTTPIGMKGRSMDLMPVSLMDVYNFDKNLVVYDVIYNPIKTKLLQECEKRGLRTINGLDMLINQGAKALEIWTGKMPDVQAMKIAALEVL